MPRRPCSPELSPERVDQNGDPEVTAGKFNGAGSFCVGGDLNGIKAVLGWGEYQCFGKGSVLENASETIERAGLEEEPSPPAAPPAPAPPPE